MSESNVHHQDGVRLAPVEPRHYPELYRWAISPDSGFRWRFGGATPGAEKFVEALWEGVLCQFLAIDSAGRLHGLEVCYSADHRNGTAYLAVQGNPDLTGSGAMIGFVLLVDHLFEHWPFRKLYAEIPGYNEQEFGRSISRHMESEGRLKDHVFHRGKYWDLAFFALTRTNYYTYSRSRFSSLLPASLDQSSGDSP